MGLIIFPGARGAQAPSLPRSTRAKQPGFSDLELMSQVKSIHGATFRISGTGRCNWFPVGSDSRFGPRPLGKCCIRTVPVHNCRSVSLEGHAVPVPVPGAPRLGLRNPVQRAQVVLVRMICGSSPFQLRAPLTNHCDRHKSMIYWGTFFWPAQVMYDRLECSHRPRVERCACRGGVGSGTFVAQLSHAMMDLHVQPLFSQTW